MYACICICPYKKVCLLCLKYLFSFFFFFVINREYFRRNTQVMIKNRPITPYCVKDLSYTADNSTEDTEYAAVVRSGTKANYNCNQETRDSQPNGNIYSTNILCHSRYDVLHFQVKAETILKSSE